MNLKKLIYSCLIFLIQDIQATTLPISATSIDGKINIGILNIDAPELIDSKVKNKLELQTTWAYWHSLVQLFSDNKIKAIIVTGLRNLHYYSYASALAHDIYELKKLLP